MKYVTYNPIKALRPFAGSFQKIKLTRRTPCDPKHFGFLLAMSEEWLLLWQFHDFFPDGFTFLRLDWISGHRHGEHEKFWTEMLRKENDLHELPALDVNLSSIKTILIDLQRTDQNFIVESESPDDAEEDFYIGRVTRIQKTGVKFAKFDALGKWDEEQATIGYDEITRIQFSTPYCDAYSRHTLGQCPHKIRYA